MSVIEVQVLQALRLYGKGRSSDAQELLMQTLALAEPEGSVRVFVDEGEAMRLLIADWQTRIAEDSGSASQPETLRLLAHARQLLATFGESSPTSAPKSAIRSPQSAILVEPLSERELEVLRLLAEGLRYAEIAGRLVVSLNTVRFHVKEIYGKLGVNRQAQAVARARELGLL
jgi:LuxR family maltose regulon positive regulatory protein